MARAQKKLLVQVPFDVGTSRVAPCTRKRAWSEALHAAGRISTRATRAMGWNDEPNIELGMLLVTQQE